MLLESIRVISRGPNNTVGVVWQFGLTLNVGSNAMK